MPISKSPLITALLGAFFLVCLVTDAGAQERASPLHWSGQKTNVDLKSGTVEVIGNAAVHTEGDSLYADRILIEKETRVIHAYGSVSYVGKGALVQAAEMHFNVDNRTGTIHNGRVSTENFTLSGERINKLGANRFQVFRGEYSTCKDCPQSWSFQAKDVDLELEGYARLSNVTAKINDAPALWIPYIVVPIKTRRQSGVLIPRFGSGTAGFYFVQPVFWAINRSSDMTLGLGSYGGRGRRLEWEGRYALRNGDGVANFWHLTDRTFRDYLDQRGFGGDGDFSRNRYAYQLEQKQELPFGVFGKLRLRGVSDNLYPTLIGDVDPKNNPYLTSDLSLTHTNDKVSIYGYASRYRNLLNLSNQSNPGDTLTNEDPRDFDSRTVQVLPQVVLTTNNKLFFDNHVASGMDIGLTNFSRSAGPFDPDQIPDAVSNPVGGVDCPAVGPCLGRDPIREATRLTVNPRVSTALRPFDVMSITPSLQYKHYVYDFQDQVPDLSRGYLHLQTDISTQLERVYESGNPQAPRVKHLIRPRLTYSLIPYRREPGHPFVQQIEYARENNVTGYNFDSEDIVPMDASAGYQNYFMPLGHSLFYGFTQQLIRKRENPAGAPSYLRAIDWTAGQSVSFREFSKAEEEQRPLSRVFSLINVNVDDRVTGYLDYYYTPYQPQGATTSRHVYSTGMTYIMERSTRYNVLSFERSFSLNYFFNRTTTSSQSEGVGGGFVYSINDFIMPTFNFRYDLVTRRWQRTMTGITFQSPSQCWKLDLGVVGTIREKERADEKAWVNTFEFNLSLNLTGSGFGGITGAPAGARPGSSASVNR